MTIVPHDQQTAIMQAVGLDPRRPETQALMIIAQKYQLDPLLGHIFLVPKKGGGSQTYISRDAQLHIAHRSGMFDGMTTKVEKVDKMWYATCDVYRKDMRVPISFTATCEIPDPKGRDARMMAIARAERNALKRAFDIQIDVFDPDEPSATVTAIRQVQPVALPDIHPPVETAALPPGGGGGSQEGGGAPVGEPVEPPAAPQDRLRARLTALGFDPDSVVQSRFEKPWDDLTAEDKAVLTMRCRELEQKKEA